MSDVPAADLARKVRWLAYAIGGFGLGMGQQINFLVPLRAREMGASFEVIGLIVAAAAIAPALLSVPLGSLIDRFGSRTSFIATTTITGITAVAITFVDNYWWLLLLQFLFGTVRTGGWIASQTYVTSLGRSSDRAALTGRFSFVSNLGSTLGPLGAGAAAQLFGFRLAFVFLAVYAFVFALLGCFLPRVETTHAAAREPGTGMGFRGAAHLFTIRGIRVAMMLTGTRLWMSWTFAGFFPVLLVERGVAAGIAGSVVGFHGFVAMVTAPTAGFWCRHRSPATVAAMGLGAGALGLTIAPLATVVPFVYLTPLLVGLGTGLSLPLLLTMVTHAAPVHQRGTALGLRQAVNNLAGAGAPLLVGPLITALGMGVAFGVSGGFAACVLVGAAVVAGGRDTERESTKELGASPAEDADSSSREENADGQLGG